METQSNVSGKSGGTNKGGVACNKHCLAPECHMKMIPGSNWAKHAKTEIHGGKAPESRRCNGEGCLSCEEAKEIKKKKGKYFWRHARTLGGHARTLGGHTISQFIIF
jgi:hypothetical protein